MIAAFRGFEGWQWAVIAMLIAGNCFMCLTVCVLGVAVVQKEFPAATATATATLRPWPTIEPSETATPTRAPSATFELSATLTETPTIVISATLAETSTTEPTMTTEPSATPWIVPTEPPTITLWPINTIGPSSTPRPPSGTQLPDAGNCSCLSDTYNCNDFTNQPSAQACYQNCMTLTGKDIHGLDGDNNGLACESDFP